MDPRSVKDQKGEDVVAVRERVVRSTKRAETERVDIQMRMVQT